MTPILFLDSGIGGLPYCCHFLHRNPGETVMYIADRANFPYGPKERDEVITILTALLGKLTGLFKPRLAVLACNTASVSALESLRHSFPRLPLVGTVPAVKPAVQESCRRIIGVLGTSRTIEDPYIGELAAQYGPDCAIRGIAAPELVEFVERRFAAADGAERRRTVEAYIGRFKQLGADAIVLGCTHFLHLLEDFRAAAAPDIRVYDSIDGVSRRVEALLDERGLPGQTSGENLFMVTGEAPLEASWQTWAASAGMSLRRLVEEEYKPRSFTKFNEVSPRKKTVPDDPAADPACRGVEP
jgi:glutamate racemase